MIENNTTYNEETIHESWQVLSAKTMRYPIVFTMIVVIIVLVQYLLYGFAAAAITTVAAGLSSYFFFRSAKKKIAKAEKSSIDRIKSNYENGYYTCNMIFDDDKILVRPEGSEEGKEIPHIDFLRMKETENLMILFYLRKGFVMVDKRGFVKGNAEELRQLMKRYKK